MRNALQASSPDYVFLILQIPDLFGKQDFGKDYATLLYSWLKDNYTPKLHSRRPPPYKQTWSVPTLWERKPTARIPRGMRD